MRDKLRINGEVVDVTAGVAADGTAQIRIGDQVYAVSGVRREDGSVSFSLDGVSYRFHLRTTPDMVEVTDGRGYHRFNRVIEGAEEEEAGADALVSQMPGTILKLLCDPGAEVSKGTPLLILEAMKMEHEVCAPSDGTVSGYPHSEGERVMPGDLLVEFAAAE